MTIPVWGLVAIIIGSVLVTAAIAYLAFSWLIYKMFSR
jgi:hypothetical protein